MNEQELRTIKDLAAWARANHPPDSLCPITHELAKSIHDFYSAAGVYILGPSEPDARQQLHEAFNKLIEADQ